MLKLLDWVLDKLPGPAVVYLTAFVIGVSEAADAIPADTPGSQGVTEWLVRLAAGAAALAAVIRRNTEVPALARGLRLPPGVDLMVRAETATGGDVIHKPPR